MYGYLMAGFVQWMNTMAASFKALVNQFRPRLVSMGAAHAEGESCVCDLTEMLGLSQPTVSDHLKVLPESGILHRAKGGTWSYYSRIPGSLDSIGALLSKL